MASRSFRSIDRLRSGAVLGDETTINRGRGPSKSVTVVSPGGDVPLSLLYPIVPG